MSVQEHLSKRWNALLDAADAEQRARIFEELAAAYTHPSRHYHDIHHIDSCLRELDRVRNLVPDSRAVELAIWFHDAVYDATRPDNEERSAELATDALARLGVDPTLGERVRGLILDTRHKSPPATRDGKWIVDIDLAGLAASAEVFDENTRKIRREFAHLDEDTFRTGRGKLLTDLLARPRIYYTTFYYDRCETAARQNLQRAVDRMNAAGG